jgi:hypothetical protein
MKPIRLLAAVLMLGMASSVASADRYPDAPVYRGGDEPGGYGEPWPGRGHDLWTGYSSPQDVRRQGDYSLQSPDWKDDPDRGGYVSRDGRRIEESWENDSPPSHTGAGVSGYWPAPPVSAGDRGADARRGDWRPDLYRDLRGDGTPYPEYRFRGDPESGSHARTGGDEVGGYRFRPLTQPEADRRVKTPGWRPLGPETSYPGTAYSGSADRSSYERDRRSSRPGGLMEALTPTPRTYGFEHDPWR